MDRKIMRSLHGYLLADMELRNYLSRLLQFTPNLIGETTEETESEQTDDGYRVTISLNKEFDPYAIWYRVTINHVNYNCYPGEADENGNYPLIDENGNVIATASGTTATVYSDEAITSAEIYEAAEGSGRAKAGTTIRDAYIDNANKLHVILSDGNEYISRSIEINDVEEIIVSDTEPTDEDSELWIREDGLEEVVIPTAVEMETERSRVAKLGELTGWNDKWKRIQRIVRSGKAQENFAIGDELIGEYTFEGKTYECPWVILDIDRECEWEDGTKHNGLWLGMKYATIEEVQFDESETIMVDLETEPVALDGWYYWGVQGTAVFTDLHLSAGDPIPTTYTSVRKCSMHNMDTLNSGYNRWSHSAVRQWLNSNGDEGTWWVAQHTGDIAPEALPSIKGFWVGLEPSFLSVVNPVKINTAYGGGTDTTVDRFFLQSLEEVYGVPQVADVEGPYFPYWKQITGLDSPANGSVSDRNPARKIRKMNAPNGAGVNVHLRSANVTSGSSIWTIIKSEFIERNHAARASYAVLPACVIS